LGANFYRGTDGVIFVFDVTRKQTFDCLDQWRSAFLIQSNQEGNNKFPMLLLANKIDLENRQVPTSMAEEWSQKHNMPMMETSAKESINVDKAFQEIARLVIGEMPQEEIIYGETIKIQPVEKQQDGCSC
jgi:Ras-related protein Rab-7A